MIVLSGLDNGLRRQTQIRLDRELVGYAEGCVGAVRLPPVGQRWHQFTTEEFGGDFRPGHANHSALQGSQPVLLVMKKNARVLDRLHTWLDAAPEEVRNALPLLVIDDEADQASVDTRGSYQTSDPDQDYAEPAVINGLIRELLHKFRRRAYVAYTATPFANILIPHDNVDPNAGSDLYPRDFIVDLPQPDGYFGAERLFGRLDEETGEFIDGMDVIRHIPDIDIATLDADQLPDSLCTAIMDFVLAGAARAERGDRQGAPRADHAEDAGAHAGRSGAHRRPPLRPASERLSDEQSLIRSGKQTIPWDNCALQQGCISLSYKQSSGRRAARQRQNDILKQSPDRDPAKGGGVCRRRARQHEEMARWRRRPPHPAKS